MGYSTYDRSSGNFAIILVLFIILVIAAKANDCI